MDISLKCPKCSGGRLGYYQGEWGRMTEKGGSAPTLPGYYKCPLCGFYREDEPPIAMQYVEKKVSGVVSPVVRRNSRV